jgi:23S rRNA (guanosine2251-2'-O)-methyltransferase
MYLTPGRNPVVELLRSNIRCAEILIEDGIKEDEKIHEILTIASSEKVKVTKLGNKKLSSLLPKDTPHQGVIAYAEKFSPELNLKHLDKQPLQHQLYVYIREAVYEHNCGAIIRTAECLGVDGVIIPPQLNITPNLTRVAMGSNFHLPITKESLFNTIKTFKKNGYQTMALEINGDVELDFADFSLPTLLIIGGEDRSITPEIVKHIDQLVVIRQYGKVNSLNMSVAAGLAMYERSTQLASLSV